MGCPTRHLDALATPHHPTCVERTDSYSVARAYTGHTGKAGRTTGTYVKPDIQRLHAKSRIRCLRAGLGIYGVLCQPANRLRGDP